MLNTIKKTLSLYLKTKISLDEQQIFHLLEVPKIFDHGHLAIPVFQLAKQQKKNPNVIAQELQGLISRDDSDFVKQVQTVQAVGGYLNFTFKNSFLLEHLHQQVLIKSQIGYSTDGLGEKIAVDFSSPNVAKPMHVGHMRATMIGNSICKLAETQGYEVLSINHIGDWGSQFGKLAWAYKNWAHDYDFSKRPIEALLKMYVRFHEEAEKNPELEKKGAEQFLLLESGDPEVHRIWKEIVNYSLSEYSRIYHLLGVHHKHVIGESFYNDKLEDVVKRLKDKQLLQESEGAQVVFFDEKENMPPCLIKKSDGASIYATRDLAAAIYRHEVMQASKALYVVAQDQSLHFKQVFRVLEMLGYQWAKDLHHIAFGLYRFKEGKISTRQGKIILFEDILNQAMDLVRTMIAEKNPDLKNKELVIQQVAIGAVVFNDLVNDRVKNVEFDWDRAISVDGDSGPYVQYTAVRCRSLMRKYNQPVKLKFENLISGEEWPQLNSVEEKKLIFKLIQFDHILKTAFAYYKPNILAQYLLDVCSDFSHFYHAHRILGESVEVVDARMSLVLATEKVLVSGLQVLGIPAPEEM